MEYGINGTPTQLYVVRRADGKFLAIDDHSGGYPWWTEHIGRAERFSADERAVAHINSFTESERKGDGLTLHQLLIGPPMPLEAMMEELAVDNIRKQALSKLSAIERKAIGV